MALNPQCAILNVVGSVVSGQYQGLTPIGWVPVGQGVNLSDYEIEYVSGRAPFVGSTFAWFEDPAAWEVVAVEEIRPSDSTLWQHIYIRWDIDLSLVGDLTDVFQIGGFLNGNEMHHCIYMPEAASALLGLAWITGTGTSLYYMNQFTGTPVLLYTASGTMHYAAPCLGSDGYIYFIEKNTTKRIKRIKADGSDAGVATELWDSGSTGSGEGSLDHHPSGFLFFSVDSGNTKGRMDAADGANVTLYSVANMESVRYLDDQTAIGRYGFWFNVFDAVAGTNDFLVSRGATYHSGEVRYSDSKIFSLAQGGSSVLYSCDYAAANFAAVYDFAGVPVGSFNSANWILGIDESGTDPQLYVTVVWSSGVDHIFRFNMNDFTDYEDLGAMDTLLGTTPDANAASKDCIRLAISSIF